MGNGRFVVAMAVAAGFSPAQVAAQTPPAQRPATIALVESYADGRINCELMAARPGKMWTPVFPRIDGWLQPEGTPPVVAVELARALVGDEVVVDVSVHLGKGHQEIRPVQTVRLRRGDIVALRSLSAYGVKPIELSLADAEPLMPYLPTVVSVSPEIEIVGVSLHDAPYPGYSITVRNLSDRAASNFHVLSYRGEAKALSFLPRGEGGRPVMTPGGTHTFELNLTSGSGRNLYTGARCTPQPIDLVEIDAVLWESGQFQGQPAFPASQAAIEVDAGRRVQLIRIIDAFKQTLGGQGSSLDLLRNVRTRIEALPSADEAQLWRAQQSMLATRAAALADVQRFEQSAAAQWGPRAVREWLEHTVKRYQAWVDRLPR